MDKYGRTHIEKVLQKDLWWHQECRQCRNCLCVMIKNLITSNQSRTDSKPLYVHTCNMWNRESYSQIPKADKMQLWQLSNIILEKRKKSIQYILHVKAKICPATYIIDAMMLTINREMIISAQYTSTQCCNSTSYISISMIHFNHLQFGDELHHLSKS